MKRLITILVLLLSTQAHFAVTESRTGFLRHSRANDPTHVETLGPTPSATKNYAIAEADLMKFSRMSLQVEKLQNQRSALLIAMALMSIFLVLLFVINRQMRLKKEWILQLELKNKEIQSKTEELEKLNQKLDRLNKTLEYKVRKRSALLIDQTRKMEEYAFLNSHKLRGPIASILGLINLLDKDYLTAEERNNAFISFKQQVVKIDRIVRDINRVIE